MTFLEICKQIRQECGIAGTGPITCTNQLGELKRVVDWAIASYREIQSKKPNWRWMRSDFTVDTTATDGTYAFGDCTDVTDSAVISRFKRWWPTTFRIYLTSSGVGSQGWLSYSPWDCFRNVYLFGDPNDGPPGVFSVDPANKIRLGPAPDDVYTVTGEYQRSAQVLAVDADEPEMPEDFHMLIVYESMRKYAAFHGAPEVWAQAKDQAAAMWTDLYADQLPPMGFGAPLA